MLFSKITILSLLLFLLPCASATRELSWSALFAPIDGFERTLGGRKDHDVFLPLERCYGKQDICPAGFPRGERNKNSLWYKQPCCTALINCMLDELSGAASADMQAGSTIVALIPTILLLFGRLFHPYDAAQTLTVGRVLVRRYHQASRLRTSPCHPRLLLWHRTSARHLSAFQ